MAITWRDCQFEELSGADVYAIVELREQVFVVEQKCVYLDADGLDRGARHLLAEDSGQLAAYLRLLPAGVKYAEPAIGRVVVAPAYRGTGLGRELMQRGIALAAGAPIRLSAQAHLETFYAELGFARASDVYDEDGIPHLEMLRRA
jgi:ElaA protein